MVRHVVYILLMYFAIKLVCASDLILELVDSNHAADCAVSVWTNLLCERCVGRENSESDQIWSTEGYRFKRRANLDRTHENTYC